MNPDYVLIFLMLLIILLFYLAIKYFKVLFFYLWVLLGILLGVYWRIFLEDTNLNLGFLNRFISNLWEFFKDSKILHFLSENSVWLFFIFLILLFHKFFYYLLLIILYFLKWLTTSILNWISSRKDRKKESKENNLDINIIDWQNK